MYIQYFDKKHDSFEKYQLIKSLSNYVCFGCFFDGNFLSLKRFHQKFTNFFWFHSKYIHTIKRFHQKFINFFSFLSM